MKTDVQNKKLLKDMYDVDMWSDETIVAFRKALLEWYDLEKRDLPWRRSNDPYLIWVSEIMLQQTRVDTVIPYFERFTSTYPAIQNLAEAEPDRLLKMWEGLGYYSRVRNMQTAAQQIVNEFDGVFPTIPRDILSLKGIGPYTGGAVASIAFQLPEPAVDGNVMRVVSRLFEIKEDITKPATRKIFEAVIRVLIDPDRPGDFNQALMDLGATICTPTNYNGELSPVGKFDRSYQNGTWANYPVKTKKKKAVPVYYDALAIQNEKGEWLLEQRPEKGLLANMWHFPLVEKEKQEEKKWKEFPEGHEQHLTLYAQEHYGLPVQIQMRAIGEAQHLFSHLKWTLSVHYGIVEKHEEYPLPPHCQWVSQEAKEAFAFPVPQQKMWKIALAFNETKK